MPPVLLLLICKPGECFYCGSSLSSCNITAKDALNLRCWHFAVTIGHLNVVDQTSGFESNANADKDAERKLYVIVEIGDDFFFISGTACSTVMT